MKPYMCLFIMVFFLQNFFCIEWILVGRNGIEFEHIDLYLNIGNATIKRIGIDSYMKGIIINHIVVKQMDESMQGHIESIIEDRSIFYGIQNKNNARCRQWCIL